MKRTIFASDRIGISQRKITDEGYLVAPGVLARSGVYEYLASELGLDEGGAEL